MREFGSPGRLALVVFQDIAKCEDLGIYPIAAVVCGSYDVKYSGSVLPRDSLFLLGISCL